MNSLFLLFLAATSAIVLPHDEPVPLMHWDFNKKFIKQDILVAQKGPDLTAPQERRNTLVARVPSLINEGKQKTTRTPQIEHGFRKEL